MDDDKLMRLLNSVGKTIYVRCHDLFADDRIPVVDVIEHLSREYGYAETGSRTRVNCARRIMREGLDSKALQIVADARVDVDVRRRALELLKKQAGGGDTSPQQMAISVSKIAGELDQVYCPFTGKPVHSEDGVNALPSLLFVYYGNAGEYGYVSDALITMLEDIGIPCTAADLELSPEELTEKLTSDRAFILEIDTGWNGVNSYGFIVPSLP